MECLTAIDTVDALAVYWPAMTRPTLTIRIARLRHEQLETLRDQMQLDSMDAVIAMLIDRGDTVARMAAMQREIDALRQMIAPPASSARGE